MGLVVLEALSLGLKVIASELKALHELSGEYLVESGNVQAWKESIKKFLETGASSKFDPEKIIDVHKMSVLTEKFYRA